MFSFIVKDNLMSLDRKQVFGLANYKLPFPSDAPVNEDLTRLGYADLRQFAPDEGSVKSERCKVRYLAALFPGLSIPRLAEQIAGILSNVDLSLSDIRVILDGRYLHDASKRTSEVPVTAIQEVGRSLSSGGCLRDAARASRVSIDTVRAIDEYLGLSQLVEDNRMDTAVIAVREGWTVGKVAQVTGMSRSRAHRYMVRARKVLVEIGEVSA
jgi:AraC-like DNA-binding protein